MHDLTRIEHALETGALHDKTFERCAQDLLSVVYPGLSPIPGGTDWGRDGDITTVPATGGPATRLMVTTSRTLDGVRQNLLRGIRSLRAHGQVVERVVLANPASLPLLDRQRLVASARKVGVALAASDIYERGYFASRLRRDGYWRKELLKLPSGPICLSSLPSELAESPWSGLPLVAREDELASLAGAGDVILTGPAGVGKSRVAAELDRVAFVDKDADLEQIASEMRQELPVTVVVDDAAGHEALVRRLLSLRATEPDLFAYRLVLVCWPDEVSGLQAVLPGARRVSLGLVERAEMDGLLRHMGLSGRLAREEILSQAEGRPGWAVALADLLLRPGDLDSLLRGEALLGHADRFLRRAGLAAEAVDVLAVVAALDGVRDTDLRGLVEETGISRPTLRSVLDSAARGGVLDVVHQHDWTVNRPIRSYHVRPPMLARVLVTERGFEGPVPGIDFASLPERWPERLPQLAGSAIESVLLQAEPASRTNPARVFADQLWDRALADEDVPDTVKNRLSLRYLQVDAAAATRVVARARNAFDTAVRSGEVDTGWIEPMVEVAARAVRWYQDPTGMTLLFDACLLHPRPVNPHPGHPLRQLQDLVSRFDPELPRNLDLRFTLAEALTHWVSTVPDDSPHRLAAASVLGALFTLRLHSTSTDPGNPLTVRLGETILPPDEAARVLAELWPVAVSLLDRGNLHVADELISVAETWLHQGSGHDRSFARAHPGDRVAAARGITTTVISRLSQLRPEIARAGVTWPDRLEIVCTALAEQVSDPVPWLSACQTTGLMPQGMAFADRALQQGQLTQQTARDLLASPPARWRILRLLLATPNPPGWALDHVIDALEVTDLDVLETLVIRKELTTAQQVALLTRPPTSVRAIVAMAMLAEAPHHDTAERIPGAIEDAWVAAIRGTDATTLKGLSRYEATRVCEYLAHHYPEVLTHVVEGALDRHDGARANQPLPHEALETLQLLPPSYRTMLWQRFKTETWAKSRLLPSLTGTDLKWLSQMLDHGELTADDATNYCFTGLGPTPPIEALAALLVPRGVEPERIAWLSAYGFQWGEDSDRYQSILDDFCRLADSQTNTSVQAVARAGIRIFTAARDEAASKERQARVRGHSLSHSQIARTEHRTHPPSPPNLTEPPIPAAKIRST